MKTKFFAIIFLFMPLMVFAQSGPKFTIEGGDQVDMGKHPQGKEVISEIKFKNTGDADLKIISVSTSCGCSSALASGDVIKVGEAGSIKFTFNGQSPGTVTKYVTVVTNETSNPNHQIAVSMTMVQPISFNPGSIIAEGKVGDEVKQTATLKYDNEGELTISEISSNSPVVKVTSDKMTLLNGEAAALNISIKLFEESPVNAAITIKTSQGEFSIPILVDVKAN